MRSRQPHNDLSLTLNDQSYGIRFLVLGFTKICLDLDHTCVQTMNWTEDRHRGSSRCTWHTCIFLFEPFWTCATSKLVDVKQQTCEHRRSTENEHEVSVLHLWVFFQMGLNNWDVSNSWMAQPWANYLTFRSVFQVNAAKAASLSELSWAPGCPFSDFRLKLVG